MYKMNKQFIFTTPRATVGEVGTGLPEIFGLHTHMP